MCRGGVGGQESAGPLPHFLGGVGQTSGGFPIPDPNGPVHLAVLAHHISGTLCWVNSASAKERMIKQARDGPGQEVLARKRIPPLAPLPDLGTEELCKQQRRNKSNKFIAVCLKGQGVTKSLLLLGVLGGWPQTEQAAAALDTAPL